MSIRFMRAAWVAALAAGALPGTVMMAHAELGGGPMQTPAGATVNAIAPVARAAVASGASSSSATANYTVKQTTLSSGTVVREYIGQDGTVFGIAWQGPRMPDLTTLLGNYFPEYASGVQALRAQRKGRGPVSVADSGLVVHSAGHMGSFFGQAFLPQALPAGVTADDIQ